MSDDSLSPRPTLGPTTDPDDPEYWRIDLLDLEVSRVFEVCHECRRCTAYCDSFPRLFDFVDADPDGDVKNLTTAQVGEVMDACFQCKLCEVQCPYTPREEHTLQIDVPKL
ncbi:MAG: (Fe-S)-binding protein, partial [Myxococcota bacterium]